jgi:hypothetical protein
MEVREKVWYDDYDDDDDKSVQFLITYVPRPRLEGQLQKQHSVDNNNYIMEKEKFKHNNYKAIFGNSTVEKILFVPDITYRSISVLRTRKQCQ